MSTCWMYVSGWVSTAGLRAYNTIPDAPLLVTFWLKGKYCRPHPVSGHWQYEDESWAVHCHGDLAQKAMDTLNIGDHLMVFGFPKLHIHTHKVTGQERAIQQIQAEEFTLLDAPIVSHFQLKAQMEGTPWHDPREWEQRKEGMVGKPLWAMAEEEVDPPQSPRPSPPSRGGCESSSQAGAGPSPNSFVPASPMETDE